MTGKIISQENVAEIVLDAPVIRPPVYIEEFRFQMEGVTVKHVEWHLMENLVETAGIGLVDTYLLDSRTRRPVASSGTWEDVIFVECPDLQEMTDKLIPQSILLVVKARTRNNQIRYLVTADGASALVAGMSMFDTKTPLGRKVATWFENNSMRRRMKPVEDETEIEE